MLIYTFGKSRDVLKDISAPSSARSSIPLVEKPPHAYRRNAPGTRQQIMKMMKDAVGTSRQGSDGSIAAPKANQLNLSELYCHSDHHLKDRNRLYRLQHARVPLSLVRILLKKISSKTVFDSASDYRSSDKYSLFDVYVSELLRFTHLAIL
ncbi:hypothetical protein L5515_001022 [Caenorhabditis briggsae]|uniref:Uncharacterized protein n=1 Tax=Caenorhabditis briggsae TaxID=6238 RepID=A0AAE9E3C9_CAEBR|nr:hypothetical protein L3Y34_014942 [Caenorhabditis briggsae]UMM12046.1 hypothetical protein L5515_001022 [Caenorhabditis briggsae]